MPDQIRADVPKTDRELLLQLDMKFDNILEKFQGKNGNGGICADLEDHGKRIQNLENWRWYILGSVSIATFALVAFGRYIDVFVRKP
ncbi:MAG: hypothetical protein PHG75_06345 [Syntrophomonas sp.]|nr:hypothetical protein [Syntrophomonas sp.]